MCGIAGILTEAGAAPPGDAELRAMVGALRHRGPDGFGTYVDDLVGLGHARLAILDLEGGAQPLSNEDGSIWITFNGEIFNYLELRKQLEALGHRFRTHSDTEVLVHAYEEWGTDCWIRLNGQFAFAIRDSRRGCTWLVRDRVGIAPLFYARSPGAVIFGSEVKAILASGRITPAVNEAALLEVFRYWSAPGPETVFAGVRMLGPGCAIRFDDRLQAHETRYFSQCFEPGPRISAADAADRLEVHLREAVKLRLRADVPVGAYLSGGLDSSVITRLIQSVESSPLQTFSVRFADERFDEGAAQERMARMLGVTHHEIVVTPETLAADLPAVIRHSETPLLRTAPVPMFALSSLARQSGMRVVLTGEGADEFFGGYDIFKEDRIRRFWARAPGSALRPRLLARVHPYVAASGRDAMWQAFFARGLTAVDDPFYAHRPRWENSGWSTRFLSAPVRASLSEEAAAQRLDALLPAGWRDAAPLERAQHVEIATFMSSYLLASQGDRALMANGVEGRFPFLDPQVIQFASGLPASCKLRGLKDKRTLRQLARKWLPEDVASRRKWPYRAPIRRAFGGPSAPEYVRELLSPAALRRNPLLDARASGSLASRAFSEQPMGEREEMALIGVLSTQIWYRTFMESGQHATDFHVSTQRFNELPPRTVAIDRRSQRAKIA